MSRTLLVFYVCTLAHAQAVLHPDQIYSFNPTVIHSPVLIQAPDPKMPDEARRKGLDGLCALDIVVDKKGSPQNPRVVRCTDPVFVENSLKVVKKYRFAPATTVADSKPVFFSTHIEISYSSGPNSGPVPTPRPRVKLGFLLPSQHAPAAPGEDGIFTLSRNFDTPNSLPRILRFEDAGFGRAAFFLKDGAGCIAALTLDDTGRQTDVQITKCDDPSLENPVLRSLWKSQFSPAMLNGKAVPVRASVHLACEGFDPSSAP